MVQMLALRNPAGCKIARNFHSKQDTAVYQHYGKMKTSGSVLTEDSYLHLF